LGEQSDDGNSLQIIFLASNKGVAKISREDGYLTHPCHHIMAIFSDPMTQPFARLFFHCHVVKICHKKKKHWWDGLGFVKN
jgi:hypothetical protein